MSLFLSKELCLPLRVRICVWVWQEKRASLKYLHHSLWTVTTWRGWKFFSWVIMKTDTWIRTLSPRSPSTGPRSSDGSGLLFHLDFLGKPSSSAYGRVPGSGNQALLNALRPPAPAHLPSLPTCLPEAPAGCTAAHLSSRHWIQPAV